MLAEGQLPGYPVRPGGGNRGARRYANPAGKNPPGRGVAVGCLPEARPFRATDNRNADPIRTDQGEKPMLRLATCLACLAALPALAEGLPAYRLQPNAEMVTMEHLAALNACDWNRLMAQYPEEVLFILPNGVWVEGRAGIGEVFKGFCRPRAEGGFLGATFIAEKVKTIGDTVNVSWRLEADWLAEPYKGGDAYVTRDGMMYVQVTTFDPADMKLK